jgi:hypothetical protein
MEWVGIRKSEYTLEDVGIKNCYIVMIAFISFHKYCESDLDVLPHEIIISIAKHVYDTRHEKCWNF